VFDFVVSPVEKISTFLAFAKLPKAFEFWIDSALALLLYLRIGWLSLAP